MIINSADCEKSDKQVNNRPPIMWKFSTLLILWSLTGSKGQSLDIFDEADALLQQLTLVVEEVTQTTTVKLQDSETMARSTSEAVMNLARRILYLQQNDFRLAIEDLEDQAREAQLNYIECTYGLTRRMAMVVASELATIDFCLAERLQESDAIIQDAFSNLLRFQDQVIQLLDNVEHCRSLEDSICVTAVISQIESQISLIPLIAESDMLEVSRFFDIIERYFQDCTASPSDVVRNLGRTLLESATECIRNIMEGGAR